MFKAESKLQNNPDIPGLSLAPIKQEGSVVEFSSGVACRSYASEMRAHQLKIKIPWHLKPFKAYLLRLHSNAWKAALIAREKAVSEDSSPQRG